jgi:hypothetical protein
LDTIHRAKSAHYPSPEKLALWTWVRGAACPVQQGRSHFCDQGLNPAGGRPRGYRFICTKVDETDVQPARGG